MGTRGVRKETMRSTAKSQGILTNPTYQWHLLIDIRFPTKKENGTKKKHQHHGHLGWKGTLEAVPEIRSKRNQMTLIEGWIEPDM
jgi:hypothetical protein